jgi:hypothetical protein
MYQSVGKEMKRLTKDKIKLNFSGLNTKRGTVKSNDRDSKDGKRFSVNLFP